MVNQNFKIKNTEKNYQIISFIFYKFQNNFQ